MYWDQWRTYLVFLAALTQSACSSATEGSDEGSIPRLDCTASGTAAATAGCLFPTMSPAYYVAEAEAYFDTLDVSASRDSVPNYHSQVARWEWPPWLLLTGYGADDMNGTADALREFDPSTVPVRDCRFFEQQPFARCYIEFEYEGGLCPIYEEFTFNDAGETTFIEAWSNLPGLLPNAADDPWGERADFPRLATRVPGLGNETGTVDLESEVMVEAGRADPEVADYAMRAANWRMYWAVTFAEADPDFFAIGCGWPH